jgi:glyoxylase-like metal-dependent hydrolase (beta-lactamase superfamily II)/8-oxo-dGTP pyrophosphatase MutT (NUDIX family)
MSTSPHPHPNLGTITAKAWSPTPGAAVRQAATVVVLRRAATGMQVLLMRRAPREGDIHSGASVFPGGLLDAADAQGSALCSGLDDAQASAKLGLPHGGLAYWFAAMRECFEEAGLLYAAAQDRSHLDAAQLAQIAAQRTALNRRELTMGEICTRFGIHLAADRIAYLDHWLTPPGVPKRYDTRFFVAEAPQLQVATQDDHETDAQQWLSPAEGLERRKELKLAPPTYKILELLQRLGDVEAVLAHARAQANVPCTMPRLATGSKGLRPVMPDEPCYAEIGHVDPEGSGHASYDLAPAQALRLSPRLIRITANNGSMMTGPGTNCYLIGGGDRNEWAALDPGPSDDAHVQAIVDAAPGPIRWIFVTHTHKDHSPAAQALQRRTGAQLLGMAALHAEWQDTDFVPDVPLAGGERFDLPGNSTLHVIHTPGHAGNHLCYRLEQERMLFTGDHVMQGSTVVINPPDGDMGAYLKSLRALMALDLDWLAPGHGFLMPQPRRAMQQIIDHRLKREAKVLQAFGGGGPYSMDQLLAAVYDDVPPKLHAMARRSLLAHLLKLRDDGVLAETPAGLWGKAGARGPGATAI